LLEGRKSGEEDRAPVDEIIERIETVTNRSEDFVRFGLTAPVSLNDLVPMIRAARPDIASAVAAVLTPHLNVIEARQNALQSTLDAVATLVDSINGFYTGKALEFNPEFGLRVIADGQELPVGALSSGEKQLLLLFCNLLPASRQRGLFLIDEPELSLNVKWQRQLVDSLLDLARSGRTQFIMATHSLELLTGHSDHVIEVKPETQN
jgi:predicted ATPase